MKTMKGVTIMKNMNRYLSLLLALALLLSQLTLPALAEGELAAEPPETEAAAEDKTYPEELIVGHPTIMKGDFFTEMFGNDTADIDVRALIHGYNLVNWDQSQGIYVFDKTVVADHDVREDVLGNKTYYIALYDDLYYSDGSPITAWDYAFSMLLMMAPEIEQIGGKIYRAEHLLGNDAYLTGKSKSLAGVEVLSDHQLAITLDHEFLPYFFEQGLLLCVPYPIDVIAPGSKVYDDGEGVYIADADNKETRTNFTAEVLRKTIMDPETGYNSHPAKVSGPYTLTSFDGTTAHFQLNPYFKGAMYENDLPGGPNASAYRTLTNYKGETFNVVLPTIEKIQFTVVDYATMVEKFKKGELHLVNKVVLADAIRDGLSAGLQNKDYPRIGMAFLTFTFDWPTVHEKEVRQAIAWCMDRDALTKAYCQEYGTRVDGYYGIEQWEYLLITGQIPYPVQFDNEEDLHNHEGDYHGAEAKDWEHLNLDRLTVYKVDTEKANALLDYAGWTLNREGGTFDPEKDDVRCKEIDGQLVALDLSMMYPEGNHIVDTLQENFLDNLEKVGIKITLVPAPMEELLKSYYRETERTTDMIYLATNFHVIVDPAITYSTDTTANHQIWNNTYSDDEELYYLAVDMRRTDPKDVFDYVSKWVAFQERYNQVLPAIPIYSNIYYDFWVPELQNYNIVGHVTWTQAILEAYFGEATVEASAEEDVISD